VPIWILVVGAIMIVIGLGEPRKYFYIAQMLTGITTATYGYNIMRVLGNKITYHSPSRGVSFLPTKRIS
jgi:sodium-dependent phosphate transporter